VVIAFHPIDWTSRRANAVAGVELADLANFRWFLESQVLDISVDSISRHLAGKEHEIGMIELPTVPRISTPHAEVREDYDPARRAPRSQASCDAHTASSGRSGIDCRRQASIPGHSPGTRMELLAAFEGRRCGKAT